MLLCLDAELVDIDALLEAADAAGVPLTSVRLSKRIAVKAYERKLVLVRPDGHVAWRGDALPENSANLIDIIRGAKSTREGR